MKDGQFKLKAPFEPKGDQPEAIEKLAKGIKNGNRHQTLLGATGTGKTFTMAKLVEEVNKPTLVIAHNKTLAAQLTSEFKEFFPDTQSRFFCCFNIKLIKYCYIKFFFLHFKGNLVNCVHIF